MATESVVTQSADVNRTESDVSLQETEDALNQVFSRTLD